MDVRRITQLAGMSEGHAEDDEQIAASDAALERERQMVQLIRYAMQRIGLPLNTDVRGPVYYEDDTRQAEVILEDNYEGYSIKALARLYDTGLSKDYVVKQSRDGVMIVFVVDPDLDRAQPSNLLRRR
jgi:hypothetical protein